MNEYLTFISHKTTSEYFRDTLLKHYPALKDEKLIRLATYLIFSKFNDVDTQNIVVPAEMLAALANKQSQHEMGNFSASEFLKTFSTNVAELIMTDWSYKNKKAREVVAVEWGTEAKKLINDELNFVHTGKRVYLVSGKPFTHKTLKEKKIKLLNVASYFSLKKYKPELHQVIIQRWINSIPFDVLNQIVTKNFPAALAVAKKLENSLYHLGALHNLQDNIKPVVKFVEKSPRLFSYGTSLMNIKKELRMVLLKGTTEVDISNCQLRIAAKVWEIPELKKILQKQNFWSYATDKTGISKTKMKTAIYTLLFGGGKKKIKQHLGTDSSKFFELRIINTLLKARNKRRREIQSDEGVLNAFGSFLPTDRTNENLRSLLAQELQSYELLAISAAFEEMFYRNDGAIVLYQYDGVSLIGSPEFIEAIEKVLEERMMQIESDYDCIFFAINTLLLHIYNLTNY